MKTISSEWILYVRELCEHLPHDPRNCVISFCEDLYETSFLSSTDQFAFADGLWYPLTPSTYPKVLVGVRSFYRQVEGTEVRHLIFFEAHFATKTVQVVDPNGVSPEYADMIKDYFHGWHVHTTHVFMLNISDEDASPDVATVMKALGFRTSPAERCRGNCATVGLFFLVDYMCTHQWKRTLGLEEDRSFVDRGYARDHFFRASRDWLYSNEERSRRRVSPVALEVRLFVMARYIAYQLTTFLLSSAKYPHFEQDLAKHYKTPSKRSLITLRALPPTFQAGGMTSHYSVRTSDGEQDVRFTAPTVPTAALDDSGSEVLAQKLSF